MVTWSMIKPVINVRANYLEQESIPGSNLSLADEYCLQCHGIPGQTQTLENGDLLDLYVPPEEHAASIHTKLGYACVQCHRDVGTYPHPEINYLDRRDVTIQLSGQICQYCHIQQYEAANDSVHSRALQEGIREAATCVDCHTAHAIRQLYDSKTGEPLPEERTWIPTTCALCHNEIYQKYSTSVHGSALTNENNPDVPTCIDCHGVHNLEDPTTAAFRLKSPQICSKCHTDETIMERYGISTNVLNSYIDDFHGTTINIFAREHPDQQTNKPVCYDCHGVHDIQATNDPQAGLQMKENILIRCQFCHPDAGDNFPTAWLSHFEPSPERYPIVYYVTLFYRIFVPGVLGGMVVLVILDLGSKANLSRRKKDEVIESQVSAEIEIPQPIAETLSTQLESMQSSLDRTNAEAEEIHLASSNTPEPKQTSEDDIEIPGMKTTETKDESQVDDLSEVLQPKIIQGDEGQTAESTEAEQRNQQHLAGQIPHKPEEEA
jgi:hypothetical protein